MKKILFVFLLMSMAVGCFGQGFDSLYMAYKNTKSAERRQTGLDIVKWLGENEFSTGEILFDENLTETEFHENMLKLIVNYLFYFEHYDLTYEAAQSLQEVSESVKDTFNMVLAYYFMGFANQRMGVMDKGLLYAQKCYELSLASGDEEMTSSVLNNMGNIYMVNNQHDNAVIYFQKTLDIERKLGRKPNQAIRLGNIATCYMKLNMLDKALSCALEGIELEHFSGRPDKLAIRYLQAGEIYTAMDNYEKAKEYELKALGYFEKTGSAYWQSNVLMSLGKLEAKQQKQQSSIQYFNQALLLAESIRNNLLIQEACEHLYNAHRETNPALSLSYFERKVVLKDSIFHAENQKQLNDFQVKYETAEKQLEIERKEAEISQYRARQFLYIGGLSMAGLLLVLLVIIVIMRNRLNRELVEMNAIKDKFFNIISHDLKNPAVAQRDALQLLTEHADKWDPNRLSLYYQNLLKSASGLVDLLKNLLNWAQIQTGRETYHPVTFDLAAALQPDITLVKNMTERKNITFETQLPQTALITADENMLITVIRNLLTNAVKFTAPDGMVKLEILSEWGGGGRDGARPVSTGYTIIITDTGIGMSPEHIRDLFRLERAHSQHGTAGEKGTGLGILVCKEMLEKHGSKLCVESEIGKGSRFWFEI